MRNGDGRQPKSLGFNGPITAGGRVATGAGGCVVTVAPDTTLPGVDGAASQACVQGETASERKGGVNGTNGPRAEPGVLAPSITDVPHVEDELLWAA